MFKIYQRAIFIKDDAVNVYHVLSLTRCAGQQAAWLSNPGSNDDATATVINLKGGETLEANILVDTKKPVADTKLTFSRIILEDGSMPNPSTSLVKAEE